MSDIDRYLSQLRSHLSDLDPKRVEEIMAEAGSHLESHVAQLRASGVGEEEATGEALAAFGDPQRMARDLLEKNSRHRRPQALRVLGALGIALGAAFALAKLYSTPECWNSPSLHIIADHTGLALELAGFVLFLIQLLPAAYLAGVVGGRRLWWAAGAPGVFWIGLCWTLSLVRGNFQPYAILREQLLYALILPGLAALALAATGWLGACLAASRRPILYRATYAAGALCAAYVVSLSLVALGRADIEALSLGLAVTVPVALLFLAAARRDRRLAPRGLAVLSAGVSAVGLASSASAALFLLSQNADLSAFGQRTALWLAAVAVTSALGLLSAVIYWHRTQAEPPSGQANLSAG